MYQKIIIVGNLGRDPEMRYTPSGQAVTSFPIATNRTYTDSSGQKVSETVWFRVSVWGKQAESCNSYLRKGRRAMIEGRLTADPQSGGPRIWTRQDGSPGASFEITATSVQFMDSKNDLAGEMEEGGGGSEMGEDEIPF